MKLKFLFSISLISSLQAIDSHLELLPIDMQKYLCLFFIEKDPEKTNDQNCLQSIQNLRSFLSTCKKFYNLLNDEQLVIPFINNLDHIKKDVNWSKLLYSVRLNSKILNLPMQNILASNTHLKKLLSIFSLNKPLIGTHDDSEILNLSLPYLVNINKRNFEGNPPIIQATLYEDANAVEFLIEAGANINIQNKNGNTALMIATEKINRNLVKLLIKHQANPSIKNHEKKTAENILMELVDSPCHRDMTQQIVLIRTDLISNVTKK